MPRVIAKEIFFPATETSDASSSSGPSDDASSAVSCCLFIDSSAMQENPSVLAGPSHKQTTSELEEQALPLVKSGIWSVGTRNSFTQALRSPQQHKEETYYGPWNRALNETAMDFEAATSDSGFSFTVFTLPRHLEGMSSTLNRSRPPVDPSVTFEVRTSGTIVIIVEIMAPTEINFEASRIDAEEHFAARAARLVDDRAARTVYLISVFGLRCKTYTATWNSQGYELNPKPMVKNIRYISLGPPPAEWNWRLDTEEGAMQLRRMFWSVLVEDNLPVSKKAKLDASGLRRQTCVAADVVGATDSPSEESDDEAKPKKAKEQAEVKVKAKAKEPILVPQYPLSHSGPPQWNRQQPATQPGDPECLKVREWRYKLQSAFLNSKAIPKEDEMPGLDELFSTVEAYPNMTMDCLLFSKIGKIMRHIHALPDDKVPRDDEFMFRERAKILVDKWHENLKRLL